MKKIILTGINLFFLFSVLAQSPISITSSSMPSSGDTIRYSNANSNGIDYSSTGVNYYWDFSNLISINQDIYQYKSASQTPYAFYFIGSNKYGLKVADSIGAANFKFFDVYNFYKKTTSVFKKEGTGFKYNGIPLAAYYSDDDELYQFPLNYLDRDSSTYAYSISLGATASYSQRGYRINEIDGWGYIKTPYDSLPCLRLVSTSYGQDSINFNGFPFSFPNVQRSYKWLSTSEKIPVLEINGQYQNNSFNPTQVRFRDRYQSVIGLNEWDNNFELSLFPNPTKDELSVKFSSPLKGILKIIDVNGKSVFNEEVKNEFSKTIHLNQFSEGIYKLCFIQLDGEIITKSFIVLDK